MSEYARDLPHGGQDVLASRVTEGALQGIAPPAATEAWHQTVLRLSRAVRRQRRYDFGPENLVIRPDPQYWPNVQASPFGELCTDAAHGILA